MADRQPVPIRPDMPKGLEVPAEFDALVHLARDRQIMETARARIPEFRPSRVFLEPGFASEYTNAVRTYVETRKIIDQGWLAFVQTFVDRRVALAGWTADEELRRLQLAEAERLSWAAFDLALLQDLKRQRSVETQKLELDIELHGKRMQAARARHALEMEAAKQRLELAELELQVEDMRHQLEEKWADDATARSLDAQDKQRAIDDRWAAEAAQRDLGIQDKRLGIEEKWAATRDSRTFPDQLLMTKLQHEHEERMEQLRQQVNNLLRQYEASEEVRKRIEQRIDAIYADTTLSTAAKNAKAAAYIDSLKKWM